MNKATSNWDKKYIGLAKYIAENWSKDPSTKVGAIVVNYEQGREFIGYNGFPSGVEDTSERYENRELKYSMVVHAEVNAVLKAGSLARGAVLYVWPSFSTPPTCNECAKLVIQSGISEVVGVIPDKDNPRVQRWKNSNEISKMMFKEAGITWREVSE